MDYPPIAIMLLTYDRADCAADTLRAVLDNLHYSGQIDVHIADDGTPTPGYIDALVGIAAGYAHVGTVGVTNAARRGYGASYNLATQAVHPGHSIVLPLEDDWRLTRPLEVDPLVDTLLDPDLGIGCIRMGYLGFTQPIRGEAVHTPAGIMLRLDAHSPERHILAGHPRLETRAFQRSVGPWPEGLPAGQTEFEVCGLGAARVGIAWPMDIVRPRGDLFVHTGADGKGEIWPGA